MKLTFSKSWDEKQVEDLTAAFSLLGKALTDEQQEAVKSIVKDAENVKQVMESVDKYGKELSDLSEAFKALKAMQGNEKDNEKSLPFFEAATKALKADIEKNGKFSESDKKRTITFNTKDVAFTGRIPAWDIEPGIAKTPDRQLGLMNAVPTGPTNKETVGWYERVGRTDNGKWVGKKEAGGELELSWQEFDVKVKTFSQNMPIARQDIDDVDFVMSEVQTELMDTLYLDVEQVMLNGSTSTDPKQFDGIMVNAVPFDEDNSIKLEAGVKATNFDVVHAVSAQIARKHFAATHIFVSINKAYEMGWQRDGAGQYDRPAFATMSPTGIVIDGAKVVATSLISATEGGAGITDDSIVAIDANKLKMFYRTAPFIEIFDQNGNDAIQYAKTVAIFVRCALRMKVAHYPSMVKGTFTAIKAAIETT